MWPLHGVLLFILIALGDKAHSQQPLPFRGSFTMSFSEGSPGQKKAWPFLCTTDVTKIALEVEDEMKSKGVSKRIVYNLADSTWLMLLQYNNVKQATRIKASAMFMDSMAIQKVSLRSAPDKKMIDGYSCKKYIAESKTDSAVIWVTSELNFDLCKLYKMLSHCGMMSGYVDEGNWFNLRHVQGMVLEVTSMNKKSKENYTMTVSSIQPYEIRHSYFDLTGFKISDIPEGQNCGPMEKK